MNSLISKLNPKSFKTQLLNLLKNDAPLQFDLLEYKLLTIFSDAEQSLNLDSDSDLKFLYYNNNRINSILYDLDKSISIISNGSMIKLNNLFYLELLINGNLNTINFSYQMDLIVKIAKNIKKLSVNKNYKKALSMKAILSLIDKYKRTDIYFKEKDKKAKLDEIENNSKEFIENNISIFKELNLNYSAKDFVLIKIDEIYINIIERLIRLNKFENFEYIEKIAEELDLEYIDITKTMYEKLYEILTKEEYVKKYMINDLSDLFIPIKINIYYFLLKYIFKRSIYIYQIPFLLNARRNVLSAIKEDSKLAILSINKNSEVKDKIVNIIHKLIDSD